MLITALSLRAKCWKWRGCPLTINYPTTKMEGLLNTYRNTDGSMFNYIQ